MSTTRLYEYESSKFWEITVDGSQTRILYGALGAQRRPRSSNKDHKSVVEADKFADKKSAERVKKGYVLVVDTKKRPANDDNNDAPATKRPKKVAPAMVAPLTLNAAQVHDLTCSLDGTQRFEFGNPATKFWEVCVKDFKTFITYGPMGQSGRPSNADHKDVETAEKFAAKKIQEKLKKGYKEVEFAGNSGDAATLTKKYQGKAADQPANKKMTDPLEDGEDREVEGSGMNPYNVSRRGGVYSCTCPGWRFQKKHILVRSCKHIKEIQGDKAETERAGDSSGTTASASTPSSLPFSSVMLANKYNEDKHGASLATGKWWMSKKLDGLRAVWDGTKFLSRAGNTFYAPDDFVKDFPPDLVLDGELFCGQGNFDVASGLVRSMVGTYGQWDGKVSYQVFDAPLIKASFEERMEELKMITSEMKHANLVVQELVRDAQHLTEKLAIIEADDGEGVMLRKKGSSYEFKRSNVLLKVKSTHDAEAKVVGHEEGKGKNTGKLGALVCLLPSGKKFKVGTGLSDAERANPPAVGDTITFGYFEMTKAGVPRFPTFKRVFTGH